MRQLLLLGALCLLAACNKTDCTKLERVAIPGAYKGGGSLGEERLLRVGLDAKDDKVVLTWTMMDGSRIRASYRVARRRSEN